MRGKIRALLALLAAAALGAGCATTQVKDDPLRNTRKLFTEGHFSLYENGAFQVPNTSIRLIPPGPNTLQFVNELAGVRARQSFELSLKRASESVFIVTEGTKMTFALAKDIRSGGTEAADAIRKYSRENSTLLLYRSSDIGGSIVGKSWDLTKRTFGARDRAGTAIVRGGQIAAEKLSEAGTRQGIAVASGSVSLAKDISLSSAERSGSTLAFAGNTFVKGYAAVPANLKKRASGFGESLSEAKFATIISEENETRSRWSQKTVDLMADTARDYSSNVATSFGKAGKEFEGAYTTTGLSLAMVKSLRWILQGIFWDATIEPVTKMSAASLGYLGVNFAAFPSMVVVREGVATTKLAVEVTWDTVRTGYDLVAPTGVAAVAGVLGVADYTVSNAAAGTAAAAGGIVGYGGAGLSEAAGVVVKGGSYAAGKSVQYIGIPLASAGIAVGGGTVGTVIGGAGAVSGGALRVTGEAGSMATRGLGNVIAGTAAVAGTAASTAAGAGYGIYELSKAVVVPSGYELGSGIVLSYGTMAHLGAHSILAVSDCAYLVLSLEGPRWVLYAVKGATGSGDDLPVGAVVDLKRMQAGGEEIKYLPVSDEEMKNMVNSVYDNLPEIKTDSPESVKPTTGAAGANQ